MYFVTIQRHTHIVAINNSPPTIPNVKVKDHTISNNNSNREAAQHAAQCPSSSWKSAPIQQVAVYRRRSPHPNSKSSRTTFWNLIIHINWDSRQRRHHSQQLSRRRPMLTWCIHPWLPRAAPKFLRLSEPFRQLTTTMTLRCWRVVWRNRHLDHSDSVRLASWRAAVSDWKAYRRRHASSPHHRHPMTIIEWHSMVICRRKKQRWRAPSPTPTVQHVHRDWKSFSSSRAPIHRVNDQRTSV